MIASESRTHSPSGTIGPMASADPKVLLKGLRKGMGIRKRPSLAALHEAVADRSLMYHPVWLGKVLTIAARTPFAPKKTPNLVFIDAVSGYRGVLERIPLVDQSTPDSGGYVQPVIQSTDQASLYVRSVLHTINRGYVLKKPEHKLVSLELVLLPLWKITVKGENPNTVFMNAVTGEPESYMARLWGSKSWLSLDKNALAPLNGHIADS